MTAYNVVRFRVKSGMEDKFVASQKTALGGDMPGSLEAALIKTGDRTYCFVGKWSSFTDIVAARPQMIGFLEDVRPFLEDLGGGLGITDPVSGEVVVSR
ncbi:MAG: DUF718 domain-containing protein [Devosia sp.]